MENLSVSEIRNTSPKDNILYFANERGIKDELFNFAIIIAMAKKDKEFLKTLFNQYSPVNPVLLSTAFAISIIKGVDYQGLLTNYSTASQPTDFGKFLTKLEGFSIDELAQILDIEKVYLDTFYQLAEEFLIKAGRAIIPQSTEPTVWDIYWAMWCIASPITLIVGDHIVVDIVWKQILENYGFRSNGDIHEAINKCSTELYEIEQRINQLLNDKLTPERKQNELKPALKERDVRAKLLKRAQFLYFCSPHEILAHGLTLVRILQDVRSVMEIEPIEENTKAILQHLNTQDKPVISSGQNESFITQLSEMLLNQSDEWIAEWSKRIAGITLSRDEIIDRLRDKKRETANTMSTFYESHIRLLPRRIREKLLPMMGED